MEEIIQRKIFNFFSSNGIADFLGVPDSTMKYFIDEGLLQKKIIITTREEEAIGIATGMILAGSRSLVFMQNAGFGNSISTITSLIQLYKIPILFVIGWRGFKKSDAPEHLDFGKIQPDLLKLLDIKTKILSEKNWKKDCLWALQQIKKNNSCALIIKRDFDD